MLPPTFIDHLVFRVSDLAATERFYTALLGSPLYRDDESVMYIVGDCRLFFTPSKDTPSSRYDKEAIGLNHLAFGVQTLLELKAFATQLDTHNISHSGVQLDRYGKKEFLWFDDPDGIRIEFYLRASE